MPMSKEWTLQLLKAIVREYDSNPLRFSDPGLALDIWELCVKAGIFTEKDVSLQTFYGSPWRDAIDSIIAEMRGRKWVDTNDASGQSWIWPLHEGIDEGRRLMRPWHHKAWDFIKGDIRTIVITVITALIITVLTTLLLRKLGW